MINTIGIHQYGTMLSNDTLVYQNNKNFIYSKLKHLQNMDWGEQGVKLGKQYYEQKQFEKAINCFDRAIESDTMNYNAFHYRGLCSRKELYGLFGQHELSDRDGR